MSDNEAADRLRDAKATMLANILRAEHNLNAYAVRQFEPDVDRLLAEALAYVDGTIAAEYARLLRRDRPMSNERGRFNFGSVPEEYGPGDCEPERSPGAAPLDVEALREAIEAEWYNGNIREEVMDRLLARLAEGFDR